MKAQNEEEKRNQLKHNNLLYRKSGATAMLMDSIQERIKASIESTLSLNSPPTSRLRDSSSLWWTKVNLANNEGNKDSSSNLKINTSSKKLETKQLRFNRYNSPILPTFPLDPLVYHPIKKKDMNNSETQGLPAFTNQQDLLDTQVRKLEKTKIAEGIKRILINKKIRL